MGVLFPDVRRVSNLTRKQTHNPFKELDLNFKGLTSFEAGWKFHVWCDLRRNELLRDAGFLDMDEVGESYFLSYYFLEDQLLWDTSQNWETVYNILSDAPFQKTYPELKRDDWKFWYSILAEYIKQRPTPETIAGFCKHQPSLGLKVPRIVDEMEKLRKNKKVMDTLSTMYQQLFDTPFR